MAHARTFLIISDSVLSLFSSHISIGSNLQFVNLQKSHHNYNFFINTFLYDYLYIPNFYLLSSLSIVCPVLSFIFKVFYPLKNKTFPRLPVILFPNNSNALVTWEWCSFRTKAQSIRHLLYFL